MTNLDGNTEIISSGVRDKVNKELSDLINGGKIEVIETAEQAANAGAMVKSVAAKLKEFEDLRVETKEPHLSKSRAVDDFFREPIAKLTAVKKNVADKICEWNRLVEAKRAEAQRLLDEQARKEREAIEAKAREQREKEEKARRDAEEKRMAEERARLEAEKQRQEQENARLEAERKRLAAENEKNEKAKKKLQAEAEAAERAQEAAKQAALQKEEEQRKAAAEALKLESKAEVAASKAEATEVVASTVVAGVANFSSQKPNGISSRKKYTVQIVDKALLVKYCLDNEKLHFINVDESALNRIAGVEHLNFKIPGMKVIESTISSVRG